MAVRDICHLRSSISIRYALQAFWRLTILVVHAVLLYDFWTQRLLAAGLGSLYQSPSSHANTFRLAKSQAAKNPM